MKWIINIDQVAQKQLSKIDPYNEKQIISYLKDKILKLTHPKQLGKALLGDKKGLWRYRVEDFRIICEIDEIKLIIKVLAIGNRKYIY